MSLQRQTPSRLKQPPHFNARNSQHYTSKEDPEISSHSLITCPGVPFQEAAQLQRTLGNRFVGSLIRERHSPTSLTSKTRAHEEKLPIWNSGYNSADLQTVGIPENHSLLIQRDEIEFEVVDPPPPVPSHPGTVEEIATDTIRTMEAQLDSYRTAIDDFSEVIKTESKEEAAPSDPVITIVSKIGDFVVNKLMDKALKIGKGAGVIKSVMDLGLEIDNAVREEKRRSVAATTRNKALDFIITCRNKVTMASNKLKSNMTESVIAVRKEYAGAKSEAQKQDIRSRLELANFEATRELNTVLSPQGLFTMIIEEWINQSKAPGEKHNARVSIQLDNNWKVIQAYLHAPFGSRLADQLQRLGPLDLVNFNVPRVLIWYPNYHKKDNITIVAADLPPENNRIENLRYNLTGRHHVGRFIELVKTQPIPDTTKISGSKTGTY